MPHKVSKQQFKHCYIETHRDQNDGDKTKLAIQADAEWTNILIAWNLIKEPKNKWPQQFYDGVRNTMNNWKHQNKPKCLIQKAKPKKLKNRTRQHSEAPIPGKQKVESLKQQNKNSVTFEIASIDANKQTVASKQSVYERIVEAQGTKTKKVVDEIRAQFEKAYFTENESKCNDNDTKPVDLNGWDENLKDGIRSAVSSTQTYAFDEIVQKFEQRVNEKLAEHKSLEQKVKQNVNKTEIDKELDALINSKRQKLEIMCNNKLKEIKEYHESSNIMWEKTQSETLKNSGFAQDVKAEIAKFREKRAMYQQRQIANIEREYNKQQHLIDELQDKQKDALKSTNDIKKWHETFEAEEVRQEKKKTLQEMIKRKIEATNSQIRYAKYLHNSPFAPDLTQKAKELDHEITKIATLSDEVLVIDAVNRDSDDIYNDDDDDDDAKSQDINEKELEFELRFDDEYTNWNSSKQDEIKRNLADIIGIKPEELSFISSREGCIICKFKAKLKAVHEKVKEVGRGIKAGVKRGKDYGYKSMKKELPEYTKVFVDNTWTKKVDDCVSFLEHKVGKVKTSKDALYLASKCVAVIITQFTSDSNRQVLDDKFLKDDGLKEYHKVIMNPKWDKEYGEGKIFWKGANTDGTDRGGYPYFCPVGWKRYGIRIDDFDTKYKGWSVCYHGTQSHYLGSILSHGIFGTQDVQQRYFSPSIEYSAHPRYGTPQKLKDGRYIQTVFQCRINPKVMTKIGTTTGGNHTIIDPNFTKEKQQNEIEWYLQEPNLDQYIVYGMMVRVSDDPAKLPSAHWWGEYEKTWGGSGYRIKWRID